MLSTRTAPTKKQVTVHLFGRSLAPNTYLGQYTTRALNCQGEPWWTCVDPFIRWLLG